jgi:hypothetical protein
MSLSPISRIGLIIRQRRNRYEKIPKTEIKKVESNIKTTSSDKPVATSTPKAENKENSVSSPGGTDYVALAEKARQEYLQKKASQSSIRVTPTNNTPTSKPVNKSPTKTSLIENGYPIPDRSFIFLYDIHILYWFQRSDTVFLTLCQGR